MTKNDIIGLKFRIVSGTNLQETDTFSQFVDQSFYLSVKLGTDRVLGRNSEKASECSPCFSRSCLLAFHESVDLRQSAKSTIYPAELSFIWIMCVVMIPKIALLIH